jgi:glycyl-tRNA synthetase beta chain
MPRPLLLEIGCEELPASFVDAALAAIPELTAKKLDALRLAHGSITPLGTPRRLAVIVRDLADAQADVDEEVVGPPEAAAFKDGKPTKAAEAFAAKVGVAVADLAVVEREAGPKQKAGKYVVGRRKDKGRPARELLSSALADVIREIPFRKSMRWGEGDATFGRPIQWIVALYGPDVLDVSFAGVRSGRTSRGHRFLHPGGIQIPDPDRYVDLLREAHVIVDRQERVRTMMDRVAEAARALGGVHDPEPMLVDENASLVEEPHVVTGSFAREYLELPAAVIRAVARGHQRYFCVQKNEDELLPHYLAVVNTAQNPENVVKGNDRVMRARLADARFFYEEDKKANLEQRVEKLAGIVFHNRLGSVLDKVTRIEKLTQVLADKIGLPAAERERAVRAAHLCKFDLVSLMVGELPELQGHMGRAYALHAGEHPAVANAVRDHYRPVGASDATAADDVSALVALADRFDTLAGCFAVGLAPTGAADPYALRRACIAALRTILDRSEPNPKYAELVFGDLVRIAYAGFSFPKPPELDVGATVTKVEEFAAERLRGLLASETSPPVADAVMAGHNWLSGRRASAVDLPSYTRYKALAIHDVVKKGEPWLARAKTVAKRMNGISKTASPRFHDEAAFGTTETASGNGLVVSLVRTVDHVTASLSSVRHVTEALRATEQLANALEQIFDKTLVNDPNDPLTLKRLELLSFGAECMLRIADFSRLA